MENVEQTYDSTTYDIFEGFLQSVPVKFISEGADSIVTFTVLTHLRYFNHLGWTVWLEFGLGGFLNLDNQLQIRL